MFFGLYAVLVIAGSFVASHVFGHDVEFLYVGGLIGAGYMAFGCRIVNEWERLPVLFLGNYSGTVGPGFVWQDPLLHTFLDEVPLRDEVEKLEISNVQTQDNVPVSFNLMLTYRVDGTKVKEFTVGVFDGVEATFGRALAAVTENVGKSKLDQILHNRDVL